MKPILVALLSLCVLLAQPFKEEFSLDGEWHYHLQKLPQDREFVYDFDGNEPMMELPSNWYTRGINHAGVVWFEKSFSFRSLGQLSRDFIAFDGVDYICDVWINDHYVGSHIGYFQPFEFDISEYLEQGENRIKVRVNSPLENYPTAYSLHKTLLKGIFSHHDTRPGGAWNPIGQDRSSGGIWNSVKIASYKKYRLQDIKLTPLLSEKKALQVAFTLERPTRDASVFLRYKQQKAKEYITLRAKPLNFEGAVFESSFEVDAKSDNYNLEFNLSNAKLWSPHDRGFPHLYELTIDIGDYTHKEQFGLRSFTQDSNETFILNNQPYFIKGTNYISSQYLSQMDEKKFANDLRLMQEAHINSIRVHAHIEPKIFYDLCDKMGFLVWQDTNLQWGYDDSDAFHQEAIKQTIEMVDILYNHPSIFIWSMHNEPPWDSDWMQWKYPDYNATQNKALDQMLYDKVKAYDDFHLVKKFSSNTEHPWFGWYSGKYEDFKNPSKAKVVTEYGAQATTSLEVLKKFMPKKYLVPKGKKAQTQWEYHNFQFNWNKKNGITYKGDLEQFIVDSQTYQANLIKYASEQLRIQKYTTTTGIYQFMFNEGWPSMNWGVVDYYRNPKPAYEALKEAFAPLIVAGKRVDERLLEIYVVNDTLEVLEMLTLEIEVSSSESISTQKEVREIVIAKDVAQKITTVALDNDATVDMILRDSNGHILAKNHYDFIYKGGDTK